ncbi:hypothetical protein HGA34_02985 [Candidatus Falkowbacteria bacterium]|nr:hypothetical protein [Candidatus Falkowbacteria bacterium]
MTNSIKKLGFSLAAILLSFSVASKAIAAETRSLFGRMDNVALSGGYEVADKFTMARFIGQVISAFLSLLGIIFIVLIVYSGYNWMTAAGDSGKVDKAKETLWRAVIGLIITVGAYAIWVWISAAMI